MTFYNEELERHVQEIKNELERLRLEHSKETEKIIQIIPAPEGMYAYYRTDSPTRYQRVEKIVCIALTNLGSVWNMAIDYNGRYYRAENSIDFIGIQGMMNLRPIIDDMNGHL